MCSYINVAKNDAIKPREKPMNHSFQISARICEEWVDSIASTTSR